VELAAASWLAEINRVNGAVRAAQTRIQRERDTTDALAAELDRLTAIAEASRAMAESAVEACREAREALAATHGEAVVGAGDQSSMSAAAPISAPEVAQSARRGRAVRHPARAAIPEPRQPSESERSALARLARRPRRQAGPQAPLPNWRSQGRRSSCAGRSHPRSFASCSATAPR